MDQTKLKELLDYDPLTGEFTWNKRLPNKGVNKIFNTMFAGEVAGSIYTDARGWQCVRIGITRRGKRRSHNAHRLAFLYMTGSIPEQVDHINGNSTDNCWINIRPATQTINSRNMKRLSTNTSGVTGVSWHKQSGKWRADIVVDGRHTHLGYFDEFTAAAAARKAAEIKYGYHPNHGKTEEERAES